MLALLASIISGNDPDIWLLIAVILFTISAIWRLVERSVDAAIVSAGAAFLALGLLVT